MLPERLRRSSAVRAAAIFCLLFLGVFALAGVATYLYIQHELGAVLEDRISSQFRLMELAYGQSGQAGLVAAVRAHDSTADEAGAVYALRNEAGELLAGNDAVPNLGEGFHSAVLDIGSDPDHTDYRLLAGRIGGLRLVVGLSREDIDEVWEVLVTSFSWAGFAVVVLGAAGALYLASRWQNRFEALRSALHRVSAGDWDARLPISKSRDDIDEFSSEINRTFARLQDLMEAMRQVSADIAHDLKTPVGRLMLSAEQGLERANLKKSVDTELRLIRDEAEAINSTFEALLSIAQIEGGASRDRFETVNLEPFIRNFAEIYEPVVEDAGSSLSLAIEDGDLHPLQGETELLNRMMANLVENSIRHCPPGSHIRIALRRGEESAPEILVSDDGPGIPEAERSKVLRRLYRLEKSRTTPGSGLGLSLVKAIATLHGATLTLSDNDPGLSVSIAFHTAR